MMPGADFAKLVRRRFVSVAPSDTIPEAESLMRMARLRAVPVVEGDELRGMLSYHFLARSCLAESARGSERSVRDGTVAALMDGRPVPVADDVGLAQAVGRLVESRDGCVAVVEAGSRRLLGILTETDLLRAAYGWADGAELPD
jgi:CBS domain-containing protein